MCAGRIHAWKAITGKVFRIARSARKSSQAKLIQTHSRNNSVKQKTKKLQKIQSYSEQPNGSLVYVFHLAHVTPTEYFYITLMWKIFCFHSNIISIDGNVLVMFYFSFFFFYSQIVLYFTPGGAILYLLYLSTKRTTLYSGIYLAHGIDFYTTS